MLHLLLFLLLTPFMLAACGTNVTSESIQEEPIEREPIPASRAWLDLAYAPMSAAQRLDIYLPPAGEGPFPVVVWIHGGGWSSGDKALAPNSAPRRLDARGYAVVSLNYRLSGEARFPAAVHDVKAAVRWLRANGARYHLLVEEIGTWSSSAGGHLAAMLGTSGGVPDLEGADLGNAEESSRVQAVVVWFGPSDLLQMDVQATEQGCPLFQGTGHDSSTSPEGRFLGDAPSQVPQLAAQASPVTWASADDPPSLIQHGLSDCTVPWRQSESLAAALSAQLPPESVTLVYLEAGHGGGGFAADTTLERVANFSTRFCGDRWSGSCYSKNEVSAMCGTSCNLSQWRSRC